MAPARFFAGAQNDIAPGVSWGRRALAARPPLPRRWRRTSSSARRGRVPSRPALRLRADQEIGPYTVREGGSDIQPGAAHRAPAPAGGGRPTRADGLPAQPGTASRAGAVHPRSPAATSPCTRTSSRGWRGCSCGRPGTARTAAGPRRRTGHRCCGHPGTCRWGRFQTCRHKGADDRDCRSRTAPARSRNRPSRRCSPRARCGRRRARAAVAAMTILSDAVWCELFSARAILVLRLSGQEFSSPRRRRRCVGNGRPVPPTQGSDEARGA